MRTIGRCSVLMAVAILAVTGAAWAGEGGDCTYQEVIPLMEATAGGHATFCVTRNGLHADLKMKDLQPGHAYTVWWVYFDDPSQCVDGGPGICGMADFGGDDPLGVFGRMDSAVARGNGRANFWGRVKDFEPSSGSQVWLLVFGHGEADWDDRKHLARQLLTPEDPLAGAPHLGIVGQPYGFPAAVNVFVVE